RWYVNANMGGDRSRSGGPQSSGSRPRLPHRCENSHELPGACKAVRRPGLGHAAAPQHVCSFRGCPGFAKIQPSSTTREALVDLAVKPEILAVFAVFVFVGAILLGAF